MKKLIFLVLMVVIIFSCKTTSKKVDYDAINDPRYLECLKHYFHDIGTDEYSRVYEYDVYERCYNELYRFHRD